ncbi:MAG: hypothetical protein KJN92_10720 [Gemmatimonadetes bacterium]|nr:hypothetical protein [Gemmatimonadota bacterium]
MPQIPFSDLPSASRLWIFPAERSLSTEEEKELLARADAFLKDWAAHGVPLTCARDWRYGRFLLVAVDEASEPPSGCSIDAMTRVLKEVGEDLGLTFVDKGPVLYREGEEIRRVSRGEFKALVDAGELTLETPVFDNSITRLSELEAGQWEKPAGASWHRRAFFS